jgi:hypothetical protein
MTLGPEMGHAPSLTAALQHRDQGKRARAGDGDRTRTTSLEGWGSTIELRPQG